MIKFFSKKRYTLMDQNKVGKYLKYAIGEIVLVVIGILIALQINNNNAQRQTREKELHYLENIKNDLTLNMAEMDRYVADRTQFIKNAEIILEHFEGKPVVDYAEFNALCIPIYSWKKFYQTDNTFQELTNSGNLALIKNDSIKNMLLNIDSLYKVMKGEEEHFRYDAETLIYGPLYQSTDLKPFVDNFEYRMTQGASGKNTVLGKENYDSFFNNTMLKNGFTMAKLEFSVMNQMFAEMKTLSQKLYKTIDREIAKG